MTETLTEIKDRPSFDEALVNFVRLLNEAMGRHHAAAFPNSTLKPYVFKIDGAGRKQVRIIHTREEAHTGSCYCFVEVETGKIMKPAGWKTPEPKRYERGNIFNANPLQGCGPYGVEYRVGGSNFKFQGQE